MEAGISRVTPAKKGPKRMVHDRIVSDPAVMMGKPCIKGTRITLELILRKLSSGRSFAEVLEAYPQLTEEDLRAALEFNAMPPTSRSP